MKKLLLFGWTLALFTSCASVEKMLEKGDYEGAVAKAAHKLAGNKKKEAYVIALEKGFEKWTQSSLVEIDKLKVNNTAPAWEKIIQLGQRMEKIQNLISPLLPLVSENGYRANFYFENASILISEAKKNAAALYYTKLNHLVEVAQAGDKPAARTAVDLIDRIDHLSMDYELAALRNDMYQTGINKIWVTIQNQSFARLPGRAEDELHYLEINNTGNHWNQFYTQADEDFAPDYKVVFRIEDLRAEPESIRNIENHFFREVIDGWEYVLDAKGNVAKDSLGNDIKKDRIIKVKGTVIETIQTKRAYITGRMEVIQMKTGNVIYSKVMQFDDCFSHTALNHFGDERALDNNQRTRVPLIACPADLVMMMRVVEKAKQSFMYEVQNCNYL
ncbi:MAG: hypothetical protein ABI761_19605 [Saprospiraceae bacterium]